MENRVYCHTECVVYRNIIFTKGEYYKIVPVSSALLKNNKDRINLQSNAYSRVNFDYKSFNDHFYTIQQIRKKKLEEIWKSQTI